MSLSYMKNTSISTLKQPFFIASLAVIMAKLKREKLQLGDLLKYNKCSPFELKDLLQVVALHICCM